jgi:DNA-binding protein H-NS
MNNQDQDQAQAQAAQVIAADNNQLSKLPLFHGDKALDKVTGEQMIMQVDLAMQTKGWTQLATANYFFCALNGKARTWGEMRREERGFTNTWDWWKPEFRNVYGSSLQISAIHPEITTLKQTGSETVDDFDARVCVFIKKVKQTETPYVTTPIPAEGSTQAQFRQWAETNMAQLRYDIYDHVAHLLMRAGLPAKYHKRLSDLNPPNRRTATQLVHRWEEEDGQDKIKMAPFKVCAIENQEGSSGSTPTVLEVAQDFNALMTEAQQAAQQDEIQEFKQAVAAMWKNKTYKNQGKNNSYNSNGYQSGQAKRKEQTNDSKPRPTCYYCKKVGHVQADCYSKKNHEKNQNQKQTGYKGKKTYPVESVSSNSQDFHQ